MGPGTPRLRVGRHTGSAVSGVGRDRAQGSGGRDGSAGRRLGGQQGFDASTLLPPDAGQPRPARSLHVRRDRQGRADRRLRDAARGRGRARDRLLRPAARLTLPRADRGSSSRTGRQTPRRTPACAPTWSSSRPRTAARCSRRGRSPTRAASRTRGTGTTWRGSRRTCSAASPTRRRSRCRPPAARSRPSLRAAGSTRRPAASPLEPRGLYGREDLGVSWEPPVLAHVLRRRALHPRPAHHARSIDEEVADMHAEVPLGELVHHDLDLGDRRNRPSRSGVSSRRGPAWAPAARRSG